MEGHRPGRQRHLRLALLAPSRDRTSARGRRPGRFKTPDIPEGYIAGGEVYDPLWTGKTVGDINGAVEFIQDTGAKMVGHGSHIEYALGTTVADGEFSMMVTNAPTNTEGGKTKIMSMREGRTRHHDQRPALHDREARRPAGIIAWRVITSNDQIDTVGAERVSVNFQRRASGTSGPRDGAAAGST